MLKEFKEFAMRGNVIDLAVGVIIGAAFGKIVGSLVSDVIMPLINPAIPGGDWRALEIGPGVKIGLLMGAILDFLILAFVLFLIIKSINRFKRKEEPKAIPAEPSADTKLLAEIRDLLKGKATMKV